MTLFAQLHDATVKAQAERELPDCLAERLLAVAANPLAYPQAEAEILVILDMLPDYDTFGQTGYMGMGVSNLVLEGAIRRLEATLRN